MKNFLKGPSLKAQNERNGFDVSYQNQFTIPFGMILPFFFQRVNPDDKVKLSNECQTICDGLVKPAFMRLNEHLDYYFIPATQLWMPFDNFVTAQASYFSSQIADSNYDKVPNTVPTFTLGFLDSAISSWTQNNNRDDLGYDFAQGATRLLDLLGYVNLTGVANNGFTAADLASLGWTGSAQRFNYFPLLCYQKVYYDFFRNDKYEDNDVYAYNIDDFPAQDVTSLTTDHDFARMSKIFKVHYRWAKKDYFTQTQPSILPTSQDIGYDDLPALIENWNMFNVPGLSRVNPHVERGQTYSDYNKNAGDSVRTGGLANSSANVTAAHIVSHGVSVANIRFAFAYDKLLRRMRQAGPDFDKQMLAQFGISPYDARHGKCYYIGGYTNRLSSSDVTNMTGQEIGELAGQINSYSDNSKKILNFHVKEHGYIIGVYSTSVDNMYQSYRNNRETRLRDRYDWFNPAFENLGLQPIFESEYDYTGSNGHDYKTFDVNTFDNIIGYVPRYSELKTHVDECHGNLCNYSNIVGMREWNVQRNTAPIAVQYLNRSNMLLDPSQFDPVAGVNYNGVQLTDHFIVNLYNHSRKVSSMSYFETF